jgi:hypothetical protein
MAMHFFFSLPARAETIASFAAGLAVEGLL